MASLPPLSKFQKSIREAIESGQGAIWVRTHEPEDAQTDIVSMSRRYDDRWNLSIWDTINGMNEIQTDPDVVADMNQPEEDDDPFNQSNQGDMPGAGASSTAVLMTFKALAEQRLRRELDDTVKDEDSVKKIVILRNGHREFSDNGQTNKSTMMLMQHVLTLGKSQHCHVIVFSFPGVEIPLELQEQFWIVDHELPNLEERKEIVKRILPDDQKLSEVELTEVAKSCGGLTRNHVEIVSSLCLMRVKKLDPVTIWNLKAEAINKKGLLTVHHGTEDFSSLGGLKGIKTFCKMALKPGKPDNVKARAILLLGLPGNGKSAFAKALGNQVNRPTMAMDTGKLMGSLVGQTEERTREALAAIDAMEPCQVFIDEIEKSLGGAGKENDGGVGTRMFGSLLTWLNDHTSDVFFIATANNISMLPPEFTRAERFDAVFFFDLPSRESKDTIWNIYMKYYGLDMEQELPSDDEWTGAEIKACCRLAALFDQKLVVTSSQVVPIMTTAREQIDSLRTWASGRCLDAETGEIYYYGKTEHAPKQSVVSMQKRNKRKITSS